MSENFRQSLLNWICSVLLILCFGAVSIAFRWFHDAPQHSGSSSSQDLTFLIELADSIVVSMYLLPIALTWHFCDLMRLPPSKSSIWVTIFWSYPSWLYVLSVTTFFGFLATSEVIQDPCASVIGSVHGWCEPGPPDWIVAAFFIALFVALAMCVVKVILTILLQTWRSP
ncbi:hypothetical protein [Erythrobacter sp.]|uniref:hypothetical protein n=1 Tax=Erythrobacter sp. TaxID=1042 RepID=UPI003C755618